MKMIYFLMGNRTAFQTKKGFRLFLVYILLLIALLTSLFFSLQVAIHANKVNQLSSDGGNLGLYSIQSKVDLSKSEIDRFMDLDSVYQPYVKSKPEAYTYEGATVIVQRNSEPYFHENGTTLLIGEWPQNEHEWVINSYQFYAIDDDFSLGDQLTFESSTGDRKDITITGVYEELQAYQASYSALTVGEVEEGYIAGLVEMDSVSTVSSDLKETFDITIQRQPVYQNPPVEKLSEGSTIIVFYSLLLLLNMIILAWLAVQLLSLFDFRAGLSTATYYGLSPKKTTFACIVLFSIVAMLLVSISYFIAYIAFQYVGERWSHVIGVSIFYRQDHVNNQMHIPIDYTYMIIASILLTIWFILVFFASKQMNRTTTLIVSSLVGLICLALTMPFIQSVVDYNQFHRENEVGDDIYDYYLEKQPYTSAHLLDKRAIDQFDDLTNALDRDGVSALHLRGLQDWFVNGLEDEQDLFFASQVLAVDDDEWLTFLKQLGMEELASSQQAGAPPIIHFPWKESADFSYREPVYLEGMEVALQQINYKNDGSFEFVTDEETLTFRAYSVEQEHFFTYETFILPQSYVGETKVDEQLFMPVYLIPTDLSINEFEYELFTNYLNEYPLLRFIENGHHATWFVETERTSFRLLMIQVVPIVLVLTMILFSLGAPLLKKIKAKKQWSS